MSDDGETKSSNRSHIRSSIFYGGLSGACSCIVLQPLDRLKTLAQQQDSCRTSSWRRASSLIGDEGVLSLWRGLSPTVIRVVPGVAIYFGLIEWSHRFLPFPGLNMDLSNVLLGSSARLVAASLLMPTVSDVYRDKHIAGAVRSILSTQGWRGLWVGLTPTLLRDVPFSGLYLLFYRKELSLIDARSDWRDQAWSPFARLMAGVIAGLLACALTQPFDVAKTRMQLRPGQFASLLHFARALYKTDNVAVFFKGFCLRASRRTLMAAFNWTLFDELRRMRIAQETTSSTNTHLPQ